MKRMVFLDELPHPRPHRVEADTGARGGVQEEQFALKLVSGDALGYPYLRGHRQDLFHHASQVIDAPSPCQESWIILLPSTYLLPVPFFCTRFHPGRLTNGEHYINCYRLLERKP